MVKYLFLDIDGPLNTGRNDFLDPDKYGHHFDNAAVQNLRNILNCTGADIVISSFWRHLGLERLNQLWKDWELPGRIVGCTPGFWGDNQFFNIRGEEIEQWLKDNAPEPFSFVVIDDLGVEEATEIQKKIWITINPHCGITIEDATKAIQLLNGKSLYYTWSGSHFLLKDELK